MITRIKVGKGVSGAVRYVLSEGRDLVTGEFKQLAAGQETRVAWISGTGFGFDIESHADADLARRIMEFDALNQTSPTRQCEKDCVHFALGWRPGDQPTREQMEEAARGALDALGMGNAKAVFVAHNDEDYAHIHIVASKLNPDTGRAYDQKENWLKLSTWAEAYEREHDHGIVCQRREEANQLRAAISDRDAGAVLDAMTRQRATFTAAQLETALAKQIKDGNDRAEFGSQILGQAVQLADQAGGSTTRYSTRDVIEAEQYVVAAADKLARDSGHGMSDQFRAAVLNSDRYQGISREQASAFRHATGDSGLALIDGQAGTGKSFTMAAIRDAYETSGARVIGLAPTNKVARSMADDGFRQASTVHAELFALNNGRKSWDSRTVVMVDEAAMIDTKLMAMLTAHAADAGAKLVLVGDDRQLSSIERGGMFGALKDQHGAAELSQVRRQHKADDRRAAEMMAEGNFRDALNIYNDKGDIQWTRTQPEARAALVAQWTADSAAKPDKSRFVFAYTNDDAKQLNDALRAVRKGRGELGEDHQLDTAHGPLQLAAGDRIQFTATDKKAGIDNGVAGTIAAIDGTHLAVQLDGSRGKTINFDAANFGHIKHGYAGTIYKGQGDTLDQTYLYHTEHWRSAPGYVALTRHRDKTALFVARNTAKDVTQLARQMGRVDERRAAVRFHHQQMQPVKPLTPAEIHARFADHRAADQRARGPMSVDSIKGDPWNSVDLALPSAADRTLLAAVALAADHCEKAAFAASRVAAVIEPEMQGFYDERQTTAGARRDEAQKKIGSLPPDQVSAVSPLLQPDRIGDEALISLHEQAAKTPAHSCEPVSIEAIERNQWNALHPLPENASPELLERVAAVATGLKSEAIERGQAAYTPAEAQLWNWMGEAAKTQARDASARSPELQERRAVFAPLRPADQLAMQARRDERATAARPSGVADAIESVDRIVTGAIGGIAKFLSGEGEPDFDKMTPQQRDAYLTDLKRKAATRRANRPTTSQLDQARHIEANRQVEADEKKQQRHGTTRGGRTGFSGGRGGRPR